MQRPSIAHLLILLLSILLTACGSDSNHSPNITLNGESSVDLIQGYTYEEQGASAVDLNGTSIEVFIRSNLDINTQGTYTVTYVATDTSGRSSSVNRIVTVIPARPFITTWKINDYEGDTEIYIGTWGKGYDYQIDWGDGQNDAHVDGDIFHTYAEAGTYTIAISGKFPQIYYSDSHGSCYELQSIEQWGDIQWRSMHKAFYGCSSLLINAIDTPNLSQVTDMSGMFERSYPEGNINHWDVSNITNMQQTFSHTYKGNPVLSNWDVSNVTNMKEMFSRAFDFNQDISEWDVSSVTDMSGMFQNAPSFDQDISQWDVSSVTNMNNMFKSAKVFNQNLSNWDISNVTDLSGMFAWTSSFNQPLAHWNTSSVKSISGIFEGASSFNQPIGEWDVSSIINMEAIFSRATTFDQSLNNWNVSSTTSMKRMFAGADAFNQPLNNWNVSSVTNMEDMFDNADTFNQPLNNWNVSSVVTMERMLCSADSFNQSLGDWEISSVEENFGCMFGSDFSTENYDATLIGWSQKNVKNRLNLWAPYSTYTSASQIARDILTDNYDWYLSDAGLAP